MCKLSIFVKKVSILRSIEIVTFSSLFGIIIHISKVFRKADHLSAFLRNFFYQRLVLLKVLVYVFCSAYLDQSDDAFEVILFRLQRELVIGDAVNQARHC